MLLNRYELKVYQAGLKFVFYVAVKRVLKCDINFAHSLDKGLYVKFITKRIITEKDIENAFKNGAHSWEQLQQATKIGTVCGSCQEKAEDLLHGFEHIYGA